MKVTLNLAIPPRASERYALHWAIPATLLGIAGLYFLLTPTLRSYREYRAVHASVLAYQQRENALRARELDLRRQLEGPQSRLLLSNVQFVNQLIDQNRVSLTGLVHDIAELIPDEVRLTGLAMSAGDQELAIRFVISGKSEEAIESFLSNLEDSPHFKDVAIINEGFQEAGASSALENIACTAHYLMGASKETGE
jgi:Tfp pilus assembly protein PilN